MMLPCHGHFLVCMGGWALCLYAKVLLYFLKICFEMGMNQQKPSFCALFTKCESLTILNQNKILYF